MVQVTLQDNSVMEAYGMTLISEQASLMSTVNPLFCLTPLMVKSTWVPQVVKPPTTPSNDKAGAVA